MLYRPDADIRMADQKADFSRPVADIPRVKMPGQAGFDEGRSIIDGTHPPGLTKNGL